MQADVLDADEVVAGGQILRDGEHEGRRVLGGPGEAARRKGRGALAENFEPDAPGAVPRRDGLAGGDLGHVDLGGARMVDVGDGGEADGGAGVDGGGVGGDGRAADVAADVGRGYIGNRIVGVVGGVLSHVGPGRGGRAALDQRRKDVVGGGG